MPVIFGLRNTRIQAELIIEGRRERVVLLWPAPRAYIHTFDTQIEGKCNHMFGTKTSLCLLHTDKNFYTFSTSALGGSN